VVSFQEFLFLEMPMRTGENLALASQDNLLFILFENNLALQRDLANYEITEATLHIYGVLRLRENQKYQAMEVDSIWARQGYGPLLYLIGMKSAGSMGLMASRVNTQVTAAAKNVWGNFHSGSGKKFVQAIPLDVKHHEEDYLNHKYILKVPFNISGMINRARVIRGERREMLFEAGESLLSNKMGEIY
jgi:hypothetical protein